MDIMYRRLTEADLDTFIAMRIVQLREEGAKENVDLVPYLRDYYHRHNVDVVTESNRVVTVRLFTVTGNPDYDEAAKIKPLSADA